MNTDKKKNNMVTVPQNEAEAIKKAKAILEIIKNPEVIFLSWGCYDFVAIEYNNMPALKFKTSGFLHKGNVIVAYDEAKKLYNVYILKHNRDVKQMVEDISEDQLQKIIDCLVETKNDKSSDYRAKYRKWIIKDHLAKTGKLYY
ncbi:MAG: hypothetical protein J6U13_00445 [Salinivirgaceae bacterium]|nr:hypothetical protein [Salinivirgaceae bacterium]